MPSHSVRGAQGAVDGFEIVAIFHGLRVPAVSLKSFCAIFREGEIRSSRERDVVVVVKINQLAQLNGRRAGGFGGDAFHQIASLTIPYVK